jgi:hypothetical protein
MSIRDSVNFVLNKLGCARPRVTQQRSLRRDRLKEFDDSRSIFSDDASPCPSDCSSCAEAEKEINNELMLKKLHEVKSGENSATVNKIVGQMLDMSILTPSKIPLIEQKRKKMLMEESECLEEVLVTIDRELIFEKS